MCQGSTLPHLPQRPFRTLPGGTLRKFPRRLGQFPFSFLAESRWVPRFSGEVAPTPGTPLQCEEEGMPRLAKGAEGGLANPLCSRNPHDEAVLVRRAQFEDQPRHPLNEQVRKNLPLARNSRRRSDYPSSRRRRDNTCSMRAVGDQPGCPWSLAAEALRWVMEGGAVVSTSFPSSDVGRGPRRSGTLRSNPPATE